jgi:hypothetical protein
MMKDWKRVSIETVYSSLYDGPHATPKPATEGPVFLGIKNITEDGRLDLSDIRHIAEDDFPEWTRRVMPRQGDIVFTYEATLNRYAIIPQGFRGCLGRRLALIRPNSEKIDTRFLFYYFFGEDWRTTISKNILSGRLYPNFSEEVFSSGSKSERIHKAIEKGSRNLNGIVFSGRHRKKGGGPEMLTNESERIRKGGQGFAIPGRLTNRKRLLTQQLMSKNGDKRKECQQGGRGAHDRQIRPLALRLDAHMSTHLMKGDFNGAITNDKFCMTRQGRLQLSHHHLPLRLRSQHSEDCLRYPPKKPFDNGGTYEEKPMEASSAVSCDAGCSTSLGSGLSESPALDPMPSFTAGDQTCCQGSTGGVR